jgi:competence protein ComEA
MRHVMGALLVAAGFAMFAGSVAAIQNDQNEKPAARAAAAPVNLNTATVDQLAELPGIGRAVAQRIVEYREKNGSFKKVEELMNVRGIGEKSFLKLTPLVTVAQQADKRNEG